MAMRTILVPYDFSDCATDALRVAAKLARLTGAAVHVVHLYEQMTDFHTENQKLREEIEARLERVPQLEFLQGVELKKFMLRQLSLTEMFKNERIAEADLIVMAASGRSRVARFFVGSTADRVIREAPCPVLVIPAR